MVNGARPIIGVDWGVSFDRSAAVLLYRLAGVRALNPEHDGRPVFVAVPYVWAAGTMLSAVVDDILEWGKTAEYSYVSVELNGVGHGPAQELRRRAGEELPYRKRWNRVATTAARKTAGYTLILSLLDRGQLVLPRHADLLRQLAGLKFEIGHRGFMSIEAEDAAVHDDVVDALMLCMLPWTHNGKVRCELQRFADPAQAPPEAELPAGYEGGEVVELGSGLRLFRRPPLQSVTGRGLTLPAKVRQPEPYRLGNFVLTPIGG